MAAEDRCYNKWSPELTETFISLRLQNESLFLKNTRPWKDFLKILLDNGFPPQTTIEGIRKKWGRIKDQYNMAMEHNDQQWIYYDVFEKYIGRQLKAEMCWSNEWIGKLIDIRTANDALFSTINSSSVDGWDEVERQMRLVGLPDDHTVMELDKIWLNLIKKFKAMHRCCTEANDDSCNVATWPFYEPIKSYYDSKPGELIKLENWKRSRSKNSSNEDDDDGDTSDDEPLIRIKNASSNADDGEFTWSSESTENFIRIRLENERLFKNKKQAWKEFYGVLVAEGFPTSITRGQIRRKWRLLLTEYKRAITKNDNKWPYYSTFHKYLINYDLERPYKNWNEQWIKKLIEIRLRNNSLFEGKKIDDNSCWSSVECELRSQGLPLDFTVRNVHHIWSSLVKTFKNKHKHIVEGKSIDSWEFYHDMKNYFLICEPQALEDVDRSKLKPSFYLEKPKSEVDPDEKVEETIIGEKLFSPCKCRVCLATSESLKPLFDSDDNIAAMLMMCTSLQLCKSDNLPKYICEPCFEELLAAYRFRQKCEATDKLLKTTMKHEEIDEDDYYDDTKMEHSQDESLDEPTEEKPSKSSSHQVFKRRHRSANIVMVPVVSHTGETTFKRKYVYWKVCDICGKSTQRMSEHMKVHSSAKTYKCPKCPKTFTYRASLLTHVKTHNDTPLKVCQVCGRQFFRNLTYRRHLIVHANERKYSCENCGKTFNTKDILKIHMRSHTGVRPYSCKICGKSFISSGCVSRHQKTHRKQL